MKKKLIVFLLLFVKLNAEKNCFFKTCVSCPESECELINCDDNCSNKTFYSIRPQDSNSVRRILNQADKNLSNDDWVCLCTTFEYQQTFKNKHLAKWFLFDDRKCLTVGVPNDGHHFDIDGRQIGIESKSPDGFIGKVCFRPKIENYILDFNFRFNFDKAVYGLWARVGLPMVYAKTTMGLKETKNGEVSNEDFPEGLFSAGCGSTPAPFECAIDALEGDKSFGSIPKLHSAKFTNRSLHKVKLASVQFDFGYDIVKNERGYFGGSLYIVAPTGNRPKGKFIFEPIVGANKSWQIGFTLHGCHNISNQATNSKSAIFFDAILTHLFKSKQTRPFALKNNGPLSQLLLLKRFDSAAMDIFEGDRVGNVLTGETKIGADVMFDGSIMIQIEKCNYFANLGYNLWVRSREKRDNTVCFRNFDKNTLGLKGDTKLSRQVNRPLCAICEGPDCPHEPEIFCEPDLVTASKATICDPGKADSVAKFINISDINFDAPLHPTAISHKFFISVGKNWCTRNFEGFFVIGGEVEFSSNNKALEQYGVIANFGIFI